MKISFYLFYKFKLNLDFIYKKPVIDSSSESGEKLDNLVGNLELDNVRFNYPSRSETQILNGASFKIKAGSTIALVGHSGCGRALFMLIKRNKNKIIKLSFKENQHVFNYFKDFMIH